MEELSEWVNEKLPGDFLSELVNMHGRTRAMYLHVQRGIGRGLVFENVEELKEYLKYIDRGAKRSVDLWMHFAEQLAYVDRWTEGPPPVEPERKGAERDLIMEWLTRLNSRQLFDSRLGYNETGRAHLSLAERPENRGSRG